jgi:UDP-glucose 4-epimerase
MNILVTGGAGYIGSHTVVELLNQGNDVIVLDNLSNSSLESIRRVEKITGKKVAFVISDVQNKANLEQIFSNHKIDAVIHFAGLKSVSESITDPLTYYRCNIESTLVLCDVMAQFSVKQLIFSSSATVYGLPEKLPIRESNRTGVGITNPHGQTKHIIETILSDLARSNTPWKISLLRYFNPIGAHKSGLIGEDPSGIPSNILPYIAQVASGKRDILTVFGNDYETTDGSGVRDYIHVVDLARGHVAALRTMHQGVNVYNLGTGEGTSVFELIRAFEAASGVHVPYTVAERRAGDVASCYADANKASKELEWKAERSVAEACQDAWRWQSNNPAGY